MESSTLNKTNEYDVIIVGGGLAGGLVACHMSAAGQRVLLLEKEKTSHHKVCGEFMSGESKAYLEEIGIDLLKMGAQEIDHFRFYSPHFSAENALPEPAMGISRYALDQQVLMKAETLKAHILRGYRVTHVDNKENGVEVLANGEKFTAPYLVLASGKHDLSQLQKREGVESHLIGLKVHLNLSPVYRMLLHRHIELFSYAGGYGGLSPVEDGRFNFCFLIDQKILKDLGQSWPKLRDYLSSQNPHLAERLKGAEPFEAKICSIAKIPYGFIVDPNSVPKNIYYVGDQAAVIPSFTGDGMAMALHSARRAVEYLLNNAESSQPYHQELYDLFAPRLKVAARIHKLMQSQGMSDFATLLLKVWSGGIQYIFERTRAPLLQSSIAHHDAKEMR